MAVTSGSLRIVCTTAIASCCVCTRSSWFSSVSFARSAVCAESILRSSSPKTKSKTTRPAKEPKK